jgi:hypothetical protein
MTALWLIMLGIAAIWIGNKVWIHFADEAQELRRQERDWELSIELELHRQRCKEQALECGYSTVIGELDRIEKLGLD